MANGKRKATDESGSVRKRQAISMETKVAIIKKLESGEKMVDVARHYNMNRSTIGTILKNKDRIMEHVKSAVPMQSTIISKRRGRVIEEMEKLLGIWMEHQRQRSVPLSLMLIQEKAKSLFEDLKAKAGESAKDETFAASHGWFHRFKKRANLHHVSVSGEAASADRAAAKRFPETLKEIIDKGGYTPQQIFNIDETGLFWKKMPERTYISREEKTMPGFKAAKDRLTLLVGGNCSGDMKLKPLLVYRAENPRAMKNITKSSLPVIWMANKKAWVTLAVFEDWFFHHFIPEVKLYCREKNIPFKILLILDNAPGHPQHLDDFHPDVQVLYLPPNTTSLIQPMDQGVIANFKKYYTRRTYRQALKEINDADVTLRDFWKGYNIYNCVKNIDAAWREVSEINMNGVWKALCPQFVNDFRGFNQEEEEKGIVNSLVDISEKLNLDLGEEDFQELFDSHSEELTNEDLIELEEQQKTDEHEAEDEELVPVKKFETKSMAEGFTLLEKVLTIFENQDPNVERFSKVATVVNDAFQCYRIIYDEKKRKTRQTSIDKFFKPVPSTSRASPVPSTSRASPPPMTPSSPNEEESDEEILPEESENEDDVDDPPPLY